MDPDPTPEELERLRKEKEEKELALEVERVKKEYAEKQKKKKEKGKDKDKEEGQKEKEKEKEKDKDKEEDKPPKAEETTLEAKKTDEEPRIFRLHKYGPRYFPLSCITYLVDRAIFDTRLRRVRQQQITKTSQDRVRSPIAFPSVPKNDLV